LSTQGPPSELNETIGNILRYGTILSSAILIVGLVRLLLGPPSGLPPTLEGTLAANFGGPSLTLSSWLAGLARGDAISVLQLGMLTLLATPLVRVGASVVLFLREGDRLYVGITLLVLGMLLFAILVIGPLEV
jgi:uncharacterized membrane protein